MGQANEGEWTDTPPTVAGYFWVKSRRSAQEWIAERTRHGVWDRISGEVAVAAEDGEAAELVQFGRRVPTNAELCALPGLIQNYGSASWNDGYNAAEGQRRTSAREEVMSAINAILGVK